MIKKIIQIGDEILLKPSEPIEVGKISSGEIQKLGQDLIDTTKFHERSAAGLSAVQIGTLKTIYVVKRTDLEDRDDQIQESKFEVLINPVVKPLTKKQSTIWEGCMSISDGKQRLFGPVERPRSVRVEYYNLHGENKFLDASGFFSHLIQHEQDHLNGVLFLSYINNPKNVWKEKDLDDYLEEYGEFPKFVL